MYFSKLVLEICSEKQITTEINLTTISQIINNELAGNLYIY